MRSKTGSVRRLLYRPAQPVTPSRCARPRAGQVNAGFLVLWMVVWTAAILVAVWTLGGAALAGELGAAHLPRSSGSARRRVRALFRRARRSARSFSGPAAAAPAATRAGTTGSIRRRARGSPCPPARPTATAAGKDADGRILQHGAWLGRIRFRGPLFMVHRRPAPTSINDTMMKLATEGLPPYEVLVLRGLCGRRSGACRCCSLARLRPAAAADVRARGCWCATSARPAAILCYVVALANMPIADASALGQVTPLLVMLGASFLLGERIGGLRMALIGCGFIGALMVAQPTGAGISVYAAARARQRRARRGARPRRAPGAAGGAGADRGALGGGRRADRRGRRRTCCSRTGWRPGARHLTAARRARGSS